MKEIILLDLTRNQPKSPFVPTITPIEDLGRKVKHLFQQLLRMKRMKNRTMILFYAFHLGKTIEEESSSPAQRTILMRKLTPHYQRVVIKSYYIFEPLGEEQIFRTQTMTLTNIAKIKEVDYLELIQVAGDTAFERMISLEQDN